MNEEIPIRLPDVLAITGSMRPPVLGRARVLNAPIAVICGCLYWRFGIDAAIAAHVTADSVYHVRNTLLRRADDQFSILSWFPPTRS